MSCPKVNALSYLPNDPNKQGMITKLSHPASFFRAVGFFAMLQKIGPRLLVGRGRPATLLTRQTSIAEPKGKRNCVGREREREREIALEA